MGQSTSSSESQQRSNERWWDFVFIALITTGALTTVGGIAFYGWLTTTEPPSEWASRGDAIAPVTAWLGALALFATSYELALSRKEAAEGRKVQEAQQKAQDRLAEAQNSANLLVQKQIGVQLRQAAAQERANELALRQTWLQMATYPHWQMEGDTARRQAALELYELIKDELEVLKQSRIADEEARRQIETLIPPESEP